MSGLIQYYVASSVDGFIADADDGIDWLLQFGFEAFQERYDAFLADVGAVVMGSGTYAYLRRESPDSWGYEVPAWVLSSREQPAIPGADIRFASGAVPDLLDDIRASAGGRNVWVVGGGAVAAQFHAARALDELHLTVMPVVLGAGTPLLPIGDGPTPPLALTRSEVVGPGAVELVYGLTG